MGNVGTVPDTPEVQLWQEDYPFLIRREIAEWVGFLMMGTIEQGVSEV